MTHSDKQRHKLLMQIIIGSAWVDQQLEPREAEYLAKLLHRYGLTHDADLQQLMLSAVPMQQTERWILDYLKDTTENERLSALAAIAKVLIADDTVTAIEHQLLDDYYSLMAQVPLQGDRLAHVVNTLGSFVRQGIRAIDQFVSGR